MKTINVIVIDDSAFMRKSISMMLESDQGIKVVATARNGREGIEKIREFKPDIVTMDIEMPEMDGLTALGIIMKEMPLPVIMVSSLTTEGAKATLDALSLGAVDFLSKDLSYVSLDIIKIQSELVAKVKEITRKKMVVFNPLKNRIAQAKATAENKAQTATSFKRFGPKKFGGVVLGISTGGPFALLQTIPALPKEFPLGIAVVQHMPPRFTKSLSERLDAASNVTVKEAENGEPFEPGVVYIAPGGNHMTFSRSNGRISIRTHEDPKTTLYRPCADIMMTSASEQFQQPLVGVIMTGMGKDGLEGLKLIKKKGGYVIAQNEDTCVVYGMPKAAVDEHVTDTVVALPDISTTLTRLVMPD